MGLAKFARSLVSSPKNSGPLTLETMTKEAVSGKWNAIESELIHKHGSRVIPGNFHYACSYNSSQRDDETNGGINSCL